MSTYEVLGKWLDSLINIDITGRGVIDKLYTAAYERIGEPLVYKAARELKRAVSKNDVVLIITGFRVPPLFVQETDGPLGAASIARAISICLGAKPVLLIEPVDASLKVLESVVRGVGLNVVPVEEVGVEAKYISSVTGFTMKEEEAEEQAKKLLDVLKPSAVIAIEKAGHNFKKVYHNMGGLDISKYHSKADYIVIEAQKRGVLTIGIGDGGNEVGMGLIEDAVRKFVPYGNKCRCPCNGGIAATTKTDILITATVSNWGGYALSGMLSKLCDKPEGLHNLEHEELMLLFAVQSGAVDGVTGLVERSVDGAGIEVHKSILTLIHRILRI
jgi:hypothetical protein